jgi:carbon-monoxide dehydrogenase small subunit
MLVTLKVNGEQRSADVPPETTLLKMLREDLGLTGAKLGCDVGDCGTCTVIVNGESLNSCLMLAAKAEGADVTTIEGLATSAELHPLQQSFEDLGALQCGFCGPGMLISAKNLLDKNPNPSVPEIRDALSGNLCRCTGYQPIVAAVREAARNMREKAEGGAT